MVCSICAYINFSSRTCALSPSCPPDFLCNLSCLISPYFCLFLPFPQLICMYISLLHTQTETVLGIRIRTFGFKGHFKKRSVIIMNHVSHFDWLFFWSVVDRYGDFSFWKVVTKEKPLRQLPILGMYIVSYIISMYTWPW